jgi:hypothetical protein
VGRGVLYVLVVAASFVPAGHFLVRQHQEDEAVRAYVAARGLRGAPSTRDTALAVSNALRADFEVREERWTRLSLSDRPFLREDTAWLLEAKEGLCGEGTRVLVGILQEMGFDATRVSLYDRFLRSEHTLASVIVDGREVFVDSINSTDRVNAFLGAHDISTRDFPVTRYAEDIVDRMEAGAEIARQQRPQDPDHQAFFEKFRLFSYEAVPASKLASAAGLDWRVFNLRRPSPFVSRLAERPRAILALASAGAALLLHASIGVGLVVWRLLRRGRR